MEAPFRGGQDLGIEDRAIKQALNTLVYEIVVAALQIN